MTGFTNKEDLANQFDRLRELLGPLGASGGNGVGEDDEEANFLNKAWDWLGTDQGKVITSVAGGGLAALFGGNDKPDLTGYQGKIPNYTYNREQLAIPNDPNRRPGSAGRRYFTDGTFTGGGDGGMPAPSGIATVPSSDNQTQPAEPGGGFNDEPNGNVQLLAKGGIAQVKDSGYLRGDTKGMEDKIETNIDGKDPAALSHGEYVIPADVVAFLGEGNNEAGAKEFDRIVAAIRKKATGSDKQIKSVDTDEIMSRLA